MENCANGFARIFRMTPKIGIIGAGIGGLGAGLALHRKGFDVQIYERANGLNEAGAGLSLWPNATGVLKKWELLEEVMERAAVLKSVELRAWHGKLLAWTDVIARQSTPTLGMHRAELLSILRSAFPAERLHLAQGLDRFEIENEELVGHFAEGTSAMAHTWIGADGLHSTVRSEMHGKEIPIYRGYHAHRGITTLAHPLIEGKAFESWGYGKRFGACPIGRGRVYWYATANAPRGLRGNPASWKSDLRHHFKNWHAPIPALIDATPEEALLKHEIFDREPLFEWGRGRITLLGDAAHPSTPNLGQGACLALEDADCLSDCLSPELDLPESLRTYEFFRFGRTQRLTLDARRLGAIGQWSNPFAVLARNFAIQFLSQSAIDKRYTSYFDYGD